ncbi:MAG: beta-lactamase family protein [Cyclobacteriaceae bacterium]|jgi:CubicO group peptidase (beta-lactamase class C family)|nr:beta-lactamase family protein [Cyclobacteriaceae bacterium]
MKIYLLATLLCLSGFSFAQIKEKAEVDKIFAEWNKPDVPGGALGIIKDGKLVYAYGYGLADLEHDVKITPSTVFYIGSVSKQFVTFCILLLEEQGKLNLDDPIQKYFPDFPVYESPLTIRHFIHHTSGVRDYLTLMDLKGRSYLDHITVDEVYELIKRQSTLNFKPGEQYLYSNSCYFMLGLIVEKVSGEPIRKFAATNIFEPLGMRHTQFYDDNTNIIKNRAFSYAKDESKKIGFDNLIMRFDLVGSGGVYSTIEDLYLWDQNFYHNTLGKGGQAIIAKIQQDGILNDGKSAGYAFALQNGTYRGLKTVSHSGSLAGYRAQLVRFPEQQFSVIILANRDEADPIAKSYEVADVLLKDKLIEPEQKTGSRNNEPVAKAITEIKDFKATDYTGSFYSEELDATYTVYVEDNNLRIKMPSNKPVGLIAKGVDQFAVNSIVLQFKRISGKVVGFKLDFERVKNLEFVRK